MKLKTPDISWGRVFTIAFIGILSYASFNQQMLIISLHAQNYALSETLVNTQVRIENEYVLKTDIQAMLHRQEMINHMFGQYLSELAKKGRLEEELRALPEPKLEEPEAPEPSAEQKRNDNLRRSLRGENEFIT